jgi:tellurite resistance protein
MSGQPIPVQTALVYVMILTSAADRKMGDHELARIGEIVRRWPVFHGFNLEMLVPMATDCASIAGEDQGVQTVLGLIGSAVPDELAETAYLLACEVAAVDTQFLKSEMQLLKLLREALGIDRLTGAALELSAQVRNRKLDA